MIRGQRIIVSLAVAASLLTASSAHAAGWTLLVTNDSSFSNSVSAIDTATNHVVSSAAVGQVPYQTAITPDGRRAIVANTYCCGTGPRGTATPLEITSGGTLTADPEITGSPGDPHFGCVAVTPDGRRAYATGASADNGMANIVDVYDLTSNPPRFDHSFPLASGTQPCYAAVSPDGRTGWFTDDRGSVVPVDLTTSPETPGAPIAVGAHPRTPVITPDGTRLVTVDAGSGSLSVIDTQTRLKVRDISGLTDPNQAAMTPDGRTVWVAESSVSNGTATSAVVPVDLATLTAGAPIPLAGHSGIATLFRPWGIAITPDGRTLYVSDGQGNTVIPIDLTTDPPTVAGTSAITVGGSPRWLAVTPDQAPVATLGVTAAQAGSASSFDASGSSAPAGSIAHYDWSFGDGATTTTTGPRTAHAYAASGTYTASVTVTDSAGTSTHPEYAGNGIVRNGGPSATASRSVVVATGPQPAVSLSTGRLDFGVVAVGRRSTPLTVTVTNAGTAPLHVDAATVTGAQASEFRLTSDGCSGRAVAPGATCAYALAFSPVAATTSSAQLGIADDASGSPHTVLLQGSGTTVGGIAGTVTDTAARPVGGASVSVCTFSTRAICRAATTDPLGRFTVQALPAAGYQVEILPAGGDLFPASEVVDVVAGAAVQRTYLLAVPTGLPSGLVFNGSTAHSPARSFWTSPSDLQVPLGVPAGAPRDSYAGTVITFSAAPQGGHSGVASLGSLTVVYYVDGSGTARFAEEIAGDYFAGYAPASHGTLGQWTVALRDPPAIGTDVNGAIVDGVLTPPSGGPYFHGGARYEVVQTPFGFAPASGVTPDAGRRRARIANPGLPPVPNRPGGPRSPLPEVPGRPGGPTRTLFPAGCRTPAPGQPARTPDRIYDDDKTHWFPDGSHIDRTDPKNPYYEDANGNRHPQSPDWGYRNPDPTGPAYSIFANPDGSGFTVDTNGMTTKVPAPAPGDPTSPIVPLHPPGSDTGAATPDQYGAPQTPPPAPQPTDLSGGQDTLELNWQDTPGMRHSRDARPSRRAASAASRARIACTGHPGGPEPPEHTFDGYVDPSGSVRTTTGVPLAGAGVTLLRAATPTASLTPVPNGSAVMSPANRRNPDATDLSGHFAWDVVPGLYRVRAAHAGCTAPRSSARSVLTGLLVVPPPAVDLRLTLRCPHLRRAATRLIRARALTVPVRQTAILAVVWSRGRGRPSGFVSFVAGRRTLATVPLVSRNGSVSATVPHLRSHTKVTIRYSGDGVFAASTVALRAP